MSGKMVPGLAIKAGFERASVGKPTLLWYSQLELLAHELGHAIHRYGLHHNNHLHYCNQVCSYLC